MMQLLCHSEPGRLLDGGEESAVAFIVLWNCYRRRRTCAYWDGTEGSAVLPFVVIPSVARNPSYLLLSLAAYDATPLSFRARPLFGRRRGICFYPQASLLLAFDRQGHSIASAQAKRGNPAMRAAPLQLV